MIIARVPLRISIAGGGTDLPAWYREHGSMFISAAINKYIYITYHRSQFDPRIRLRYSKMEEVDNLDDIQHDIIKETFRLYGVKNRVELTSHAEIPSGTGLGSSGSFGVGILHAINGEKVTTVQLAEESTRIQMDILGHPIGLQDQYVAAYGGVNMYEVNKGGKVLVSAINAPKGLELFFTGFKRDANEVLRKSSTEGLDTIQKLAWDTVDVLVNKDYRKYGEILNEHWEYKKKRGGMTNPQIDEWYELGLKNGAVGGKLVGAGGGGFLMFYTEDKEKLIKTMPLQHIPFGYDYEGSKILND